MQISIVLSIILGFLSTEFLGLLTGGLVSAGYLAFYFNQPLRIITTLLFSIIITLLMKLLQRYLILFGKRRFMLTILLSLLFSQLVKNSYFMISFINQDLRIIGFIIAGLVSNDMQKQGIFKTLLVVLLSTGLIWLIVQTGLFA